MVSTKGDVAPEDTPTTDAVDVGKPDAAGSVTSANTSDVTNADIAAPDSTSAPTVNDADLSDVPDHEGTVDNPADGVQQPTPAGSTVPDAPIQSSSDAAGTAAPINPPELDNAPRPLDGNDTMATASGQTPTNDTMAVDPASAPLAPNAGDDVTNATPALDEQGLPVNDHPDSDIGAGINDDKSDDGPTRPAETTGDTVNADVAVSEAAKSIAQATSDDGSAIIAETPALTNTQIEQARAQAQLAASPIITPEAPASVVNVDASNPAAPTQRSVYAVFDAEIPAYFHAREDRDHFKGGDQVRVYQPPALDPYPALCITDEDENGFIIVDRGPSDGSRTVNANIVRIEKI